MKKALQSFIATFSLFTRTSKIVGSGFCGGEGDGRNLSWTLDKKGTLRITGCGKMLSVPEITVLPWYDFRESIKAIIAYEGVTNISDGAFWGCSKLTSATVPSSVTSIGDLAFNDCWRLTSVTLQYGLTSIGRLTFANCITLKSVTVPSSVTSLGECVFSGCSSLTSAVIPPKVTSISICAYYGCSGIISVTVPSSVTGIGDFAFEGCNSLREIHYSGTESQWNNIDFTTGNDNLKNITINYNSPSAPPTSAPTYSAAR